MGWARPAVRRCRRPHLDIHPLLRPPPPHLPLLSELAAVFLSSPCPPAFRPSPASRTTSTTGPHRRKEAAIRAHTPPTHRLLRRLPIRTPLQSATLPTSSPRPRDSRPITRQASMPASRRFVSSSPSRRPRLLVDESPPPPVSSLLSPRPRSPRSTAEPFADAPACMLVSSSHPPILPLRPPSRLPLCTYLSPFPILCLSPHLGSAAFLAIQWMARLCRTARREATVHPAGAPP